MKKLTWALLSLMLFLGLGTAFAQDGEGDGDTPAITVPAPEFTPANGATVEQGQMIMFDVPENLMSFVLYCFVFDNETEELKPTFESMDDIMMALFGMSGPTGYNMAGYMEGNIAAPYEGIPVDMTAGSHKMRVRTAVPMPNTEDEDAAPTMYYSDVVEVTYTVTAAAPAPTPVFDPASEYVMVANPFFNLSYGEEVEAGDNRYIYYVLDKGEDFDFSDYTTSQALEETGAKVATPGSNIKLTSAATVKAAACKYVAGFDENMDDNDKLYAWSETVTHTYKMKPAAPTFTEEAGEVAFATALELEAAAGTTIYYTTDGTEPTEESTEFEQYDEIMLVKAMTVKAIAVLDGVASDVAEAAYTVAPVENAVLTLSPMKDDSVGKNVAVDVAFSDGTPMSAGWIQVIPATVYYTTDGETVPSKAAYEAQSDKENGDIKMIAVEWKEEDGWYGPVQDAAGNLMPLMFGAATHLKAIGYLMDGEDVVLTTVLLDTMLQVKSEVNPTANIVNYTEVKAGDTLVIKNPNYIPAYPEYDDFESEEEWNAAADEWDEKYSDLAEETPVTVMYYSFDGTLPTIANRFEEKEVENVFSTSQDGFENITVIFKEDEEGLYAFVPAIFNAWYDEDMASIRLEGGKFSMQVLAVTQAKEEGGDEGGMLSVTPKFGMPGVPFMYGSDFVTFEYYNTPATLTFNPASGSEVDENTAVNIIADQNVEIFYMMFESEEAAKAAEWNQEEALSYSAELRPVLSLEKNTIKAAYARPNAEAVATTFFYATYKVKELPAITLTFNPASGSEVEDNTTVTVTASRETEIFYCLYADKAAADADEAFMVNAKEVEEDGMPVITKAAPYLRCAVTDRGEMKYFDATYTVKAEQPVETVATPVFSVKAGEVAAGTKVEITCETEGAVIYYTVDGSEPTAESTEYTEAIEITAAKVTIKAIAIKGELKSEVAEATYELTANEGEELYGVSVYPNPSNGQFNLELPVAATVEVFMSNGMLYQRLTLAEGNTTLNINRSGIYFLRITGEGRTSVKRLIVR